MRAQAVREHRLSLDRAYPQVGEVDFSKVPRGATNRAEVISAQLDKPRVMTPTASAIPDDIHEMSPEELSSLIQSNFSDSLLKLREIRPHIQEVQRRFKHLPRKVGVNGEHQTLLGYRNFKSWCDGVLHRRDRTVRYLLARAYAPYEKKEREKETVLAASERVTKYLTKQLNRFEGTERTELLEAILASARRAA